MATGLRMVGNAVLIEPTTVDMRPSWLPTTISPNLLGYIDKRRHNIGKRPTHGMRLVWTRKLLVSASRGLLNDLLCVVLLPLSHIRVQLAHRPCDNSLGGNNVQQGDDAP